MRAETTTWGTLLVIAVLLAGCASRPRPIERDGPEPNPPSGLLEVPDATPRVEPIRSGGPNKPYEIFGRSYVPIAVDRPFRERGLASWYGRKFHGRPTASGETYNMYAMTAAHPTLPIPSYVRVRNPANGREVIVRVNDRGPFHRGRIIDLSYTAALKLDLLRGVAPVEIERLTHAQIRSGQWRREAPFPTDVAATPAAETRDAPDAPGGAATVPQQAPAAAPAEPPARASTPAARGFWVQLGAFRERDGALDFQQRVAREIEALAPLLAVFEDRPLHRLQAGPYATRAEAQGAAEHIRAMLRLVPVIVERR